MELRPEGHPGRLESLHHLAAELDDRCSEHASTADLEESMTLNRVALELHPPGHPDRVVMLYILLKKPVAQVSEAGYTFVFAE